MGKKWIWENRATYNYRYYQDLTQLRGSEFGGKTRAHGLFKRVYVAFGFDYRRDQQRISSEIDDRVFSTRQITDLDLSMRVLPRGHLTFNPSAYSLRFDEGATQGPDFSGLERDELRLKLRYLHKLHPLFWPLIEVAHDSYDFRGVGNFRDDSVVSAVYLGARNEYGKRMHFNIKAGLERLEFDRAPQIDEDILGVQAFYNYLITRRTDVEAGLEQYPVFSVIRDYGYYVSQRVSAGFGYRIRGKVRVGPELILGVNDYEKAIRPLPLLRNDDISIVNLKVDIPFAKNPGVETDRGVPGAQLQSARTER